MEYSGHEMTFFLSKLLPPGGISHISTITQGVCIIASLLDHGCDGFVNLAVMMMPPPSYQHHLRSRLVYRLLCRQCRRPAISRRIVSGDEDITWLVRPGHEKRRRSASFI